MKAEFTENYTSELELPDPFELRPDLTYRSVPSVAASVDQPVWRVRFILASDPQQQLGLEISDEVVLGRRSDTHAMDNLIDLLPYGADALGVSRRHLMLRPARTNLFVIDLGSTNGTLRNGRPIGVHTPYSLVDGDTLTLGRLRFLVRIVDRPSFTAPLDEREPNLTDALLRIAKAITSQLDLDDVLNQVADTAQALTSAGETGIWLMDEKTGELFLEAERGIEDEKIRRMRLPSSPDSLVGEVIRTSKPMRTRRRPGESEIKVKTGYLVEALVYVPITLGGVTFGVLAAAHRDPGKRFSQRDERLLESIADFAAIAIQNARLYQVTDKALERRVNELSALNQLSYTVSASLDLNRVYKVLVEQVTRYWPVEAVHLYLLDEEGNHLRLHTLEEDNGKDRYSVEQGIVGKVARTDEIVVANNVHQHPDYDPAIDSQGVVEPRSLACAPLRVKDRVVGVLALVNKVKGTFSDEDVGRLRVFASPIAAAVENARLFAQSERQRAAIQATASTLPQPLLILDESGNILIANVAADQIVQSHMAQLFDGLSSGVGQTTELNIADKTYLTTTEHVDGVGTIVVMQDITYVKQLEKDRSEFMHTLSHDMRSPLTSIVGYTHILERSIDESHHRYLRQIKMAADRMIEMISRLLQTVDSGTALQMERDICKLEPIINKVIFDVEGAAMAKSIDINFEERGAPYQILADEIRLYHALLNLVGNAVKFSPPDTRIDVNVLYEPEAITITVEDEGPGITEEDLPFIFEKHYRGEMTADQPGSGIGLAFARSAIEAHDGQIEAYNRLEGGASFTIMLPGDLRYISEEEE